MIGTAPRRSRAVTGSRNLSYSGSNGQTSTASMSCPTRYAGRAGTAPPAATPDWSDGRKGGTVIFSRGRGSGGRHHKAEERRSGRHSATSRQGPDDLDDLDTEAAEGVGEPATGGPYDA